jgi:hypothetical protein
VSSEQWRRASSAPFYCLEVLSCGASAVGGAFVPREGVPGMGDLVGGEDGIATGFDPIA